ncbi:MAG: hypothetical protein AAFQ89_08420 [Cyanobacteria bacterium J06626_18]
MKKIALSLAMTAALAVCAATPSDAVEPNRFDQLRRENLDKDAVDFDALRRENLNKSAIAAQVKGYSGDNDFDQLRRENRDKNAVNFDALRRENLNKSAVEAH